MFTETQQALLLLIWIQFVENFEFTIFLDNFIAKSKVICLRRQVTSLVSLNFLSFFFNILQTSRKTEFLRKEKVWGALQNALDSYNLFTTSSDWLNALCERMLYEQKTICHMMHVPDASVSSMRACFLVSGLPKLASHQRPNRYNPSHKSRVSPIDFKNMSSLCPAAQCNVSPALAFSPRLMFCTCTS